MARTEDPTPFYLRKENGETFYVETLEEALQEFVGADGYRLTLNGGETEIVIRRSDWTDGEWSTRLHPQQKANAQIVFLPRRD